MTYRIQTWYDADTSTMTYAVFDPASKDAVIIDPVLDYDPHGSTTSEVSIEKVVEFIKTNELKPHLIMETHAHADHLSGAQGLKKRFPNAQIVIGANITLVQKTFKPIFNMGADFPVDGTQFDRLLQDGEEINAGTIRIKTIFTPGHTPACSSYLIGDAVFTGDALFMPDSGTGRCDFPAGDANALYESIAKKLYKLPDNTRVFVGHDYQPNGREVRCETTIGESKRQNIQLKAETSREDFVKFRTTRDKTLSAPRLLFQSVQVNIDAGRLPPPERNGIRYIKMPLNLKGE